VVQYRTSGATAVVQRGFTRAADRTAERLGYATLAYAVASVLVITLAPFRFHARPVHGLFSEWTWFDIITNIVMFLPLGFLFRVTRPRNSRTTWFTPVLLGALLSGCIEFSQLFELSRYSSFIDVATNTAGAGLGSLVYTLFSRRLRVGADTISIMALELPLMGLVYLSVPLLWLVGLSAAGTDGVWLMLPIAAFGGSILGSVHGAYMQPTQRVRLTTILLSSGVWFIVASIPGGRHEPAVMVAGTAVAVGAAWLRSIATSRTRLLSGPFRFELPTLRRVMPLFAAYLALSALWPLNAAGAVWHGGWELFPAITTGLSQQQIFRALEFCAAFTVVGYLIAEFHGRSNGAYTAVLGRVIVWGGALALMLEIARGWHEELGASVLMAALAITATVFGGWLYHLQRDHVRALWTRDRGAPHQV
ncbi:MAG: VanZ family protein, partial [Gemmatimonadota bacterium]|nr:VanZ family protein [Gemmatimonadota bacterium]